ncbi:Dopey, N-terminal-domain-containing protein [Amylostereum chailletii]|nr:Dopey, N-terminal-domain-containing protein [Amylostereum chailletii]
MASASYNDKAPNRILERANSRAALQQTYVSDPKYKKYVQQVEKSLASFDNVHEWADFIAFLKQLLKTLQAYMQFKEVPRKIIVAKRLAQCLNPALPSGVHQRALDVYSHILSVAGSEGLRRDLYLWASGLFPFFEYAATSPALLNIYDVYFLPLQDDLRPVTKSFILALLPGLEEETGEFFEKVIALLDRLSGTISPSFFFQNVWLVMLTTPSARGTSLNLLSRRLPKLNPDEDITTIVGSDIGLMIRAFSAALEDDNLLVRRSALDLLLQSLRLDSAAIRNASAEDRTILMRAATSVVMRRDLSLNRRLYTWLLGPDERNDQQVAYLRANSLALLGDTLRSEMFSPSTEYSETRPFKIFISLLDKWEIGGPLTDILVVDAFRSLKSSIQSETESSEELNMTASTLYEAVEPQVVWKHLLTGIISEVVGEKSRPETIHLTQFILTTIHVRDDEVQALHLPLVFSALLEILKDQIVLDAEKLSRPAFVEVFSLLSTILAQIPPSALMTTPETRSDSTSGPYLTARTFYEINIPFTLSQSRPRPEIPFCVGFEDLSTITLECARTPGASTRHAFVQALGIMAELVKGRTGDHSRLEVKAEWDPNEWLTDILSAIEHPSATFIVVDRAVSLLVAIQKFEGLRPSVSLHPRHTVFRLVNTLFRYLRPEYSAYHLRCVNLAWEFEGCTQGQHFESIIAQSLASPESRSNEGSYEAFGVFWRLTEDNMLPGFHLKVPLMIVLDTLKNDDPSLRRIGETWMRCNLKSYLRVLDPLLYDLLDPSLHRTPSVTRLHGKELPDFSYERPFDQTYIRYVLETLLSVVRFGGQGFGKTARSSHIRRSHHTGLVERVELSGMTHADATYQDVLVEVLTRLLQSECKVKRVQTMVPGNIVIQSTATDLLQALVTRGEIDLLALEGVEVAVVQKLYFSIHTHRLELQNKLLHLLHSVISATASAHQYQEQSKPSHGGSDEKPQTYFVNPLLVQTLLDGITTPTNRPIMQHWLDFVLMTVPQFQHTLHAVLAPLSECVGRQLRSCMADIQRASKKGGVPEAEGDVHSIATDAEFLTLLNALERLILLNLSTADAVHPEEEGVPPEKPPGAAESGGGLLGIVTNVFASEIAPISSDEQLTTRSPGYRALHEGIHVLFNLWTTLVWSERHAWTPMGDSLAMISNKSRARCRRVLEHLFRIHSAEVLESIVDCWNREGPGVSAPAFELVDALTASAQNVVHMVCESIGCRMPGLSDKSRKQVVNPNLSDATLFMFLEEYLAQLEGPLAIQVWGRCLQLAKEVLAGVRDFKPQVFPVLKCISVLTEKLTQTTAMEDRRIRKELQDVYAKLLDAALTSVNRGSDSSFWARRSIREPPNGRDSPLPGTVSVLKLDEKTNSSTVSLVSPVGDQVEEIIQYMSSTALPNLRKFLVDGDKVLAACTNIMYYIVSPAIKSKNRPLDVDDGILNIIKEMCQISSALKAWRGVVYEILNDNRFFSCSVETESTFRPIVQAWIGSDKSAFSEVLGKVTTAPSTNIFTNRGYENMLRSLSLRRLSYLLLCGEKNQFLTSLPTIQEKLVDVLRNTSAPSVQAEVYLCVRVLLCRLSPHNLVSFWPVILSELYRLFDQIMGELPSDGSDVLPLILASCKLLDLLLVLQTEEFQVHQWIFITDTVDAVYHPDDWMPEAIFDQLAEIAGQLPSSDTQPPSTGTALTFAIATPGPGYRPMRRPMLNPLRTIDSIRDLIPFFSSASIASYESVYASGGNIDWTEVERGLNNDIFEGQLS